MLDYGYHGDNLVVKGSGKSPETIKGRIPPNLVGVRQPRSVARRGGVLSGGGGGGSVGIGLIALEKLGLPNRRSEPLDIYIYNTWLGDQMFWASDTTCLWVKSTMVEFDKRLGKVFWASKPHVFS